MSPIQLTLDDYVKIETDKTRLASLRYTLEYLLRNTPSPPDTTQADR